MPPLARERARRAVARIVADATAALDDIATADANRARARADWARAVRGEARARLAALPPDPDAAAHRAALVEAVR